MAMDSRSGDARSALDGTYTRQRDARAFQIGRVRAVAYVRLRGRVTAGRHHW
jgi:hypothetical protein